MDILLLSPDLATSSTVQGAAERFGISFDTAWDVDMLMEKGKVDPPNLVILDLSTPNIDPIALVPRIRDLPVEPRRIVAFGPHVHEARLAAARDAGCDAVLSRGRFHAELDDVVNSATR